LQASEHTLDNGDSSAPVGCRGLIGIRLSSGRPTVTYANYFRYYRNLSEADTDAIQRLHTDTMSAAMQIAERIHSGARTE
jgi:hypothetical protein